MDTPLVRSFDWRLVLMMRDALTVTEKWGRPTRKLNPSPRLKVHGKPIQEGSEEEQQKEKTQNNTCPKSMRPTSKVR